jgi:hypothetical protein
VLVSTKVVFLDGAVLAIERLGSPNGCFDRRSWPTAGKGHPRRGLIRDDRGSKDPRRQGHRVPAKVLLLDEGVSCAGRRRGPWVCGVMTAVVWRVGIGR